MDKVQQSVFEFISAFTTVPKPNIIKGWGATSTLPPKVETYAVFTALNAMRRGTNVETYDELTLNINKSNMVDYQIDVVSSDALTARNNASALETVARSSTGVDFFNKYGVNLLYAGDVKAMETISKTDNYVNRYMITLHLEEMNTVVVSEEFFDNVAVNIKLVDKKIYK